MESKLSQFLFNKVGVPAYQSYLKIAATKQKLISGNVANVSTPGYKAKDLDFDKEFAKATGKTNQLSGTISHRNHIPLGQHAARPPKIHSTKVEEGQMNSVDIDKEMTDMAENELRYTIAARLIQKKFDGLRTAITSK